MVVGGCADAAASGGNQPAVAAEQLAAGATMRAATKLRWSAWRPSGSAGSGRRRSDRRGPLEALTGRPVWVTELATWYLYLLVPTAVFGAVVLRRRRLLLFPFAAMIVLATLIAALAYGDARFRVEADAAMAILAGVALDSLWRRIERTAGQTRSPGQPRVDTRPGLRRALSSTSRRYARRLASSPRAKDDRACPAAS